MQIYYVFKAVDDNGNPVDGLVFGTGALGQRPGVASFRTLDAAHTAITPLPAVTGFGPRADGTPSGKYAFSYDAEVTPEGLIEFDKSGGAAPFTGENRYAEVLLTRDSGRVQGALRADGSVDASASVAAQLAPLATAAEVAGVQTTLAPVIAQVGRIYGAEWGSITKNGDGSYTVTAPGSGAVIGTVHPAYVGGVLQSDAKTVAP